MMTRAVRQCRRALARHSRSFDLASRFLPAPLRDEVAVVYAWCRRADDAIDDPARTNAERAQALVRLRAELDSVYAGAPQPEPALAAFQTVVRRRGVPAAYPFALLDGLAMDVRRERYETLDALLEYCFRVAGAVGLMMCHVMGVREPRALRHAAHLGIAMQLTNICRDIDEDWVRGRLYVPLALLRENHAAWLARYGGRRLPVQAHAALAVVVRRLLAEADRYYRSADRGLPALPWRCALAVRVARLVYAAIGAELARRDCDVLVGRAVVSPRAKLAYLAQAALAALADGPARMLRPFRAARLTHTLTFPGDVRPV
jgi:phytoene synthase